MLTESYVGNIHKKYARKHKKFILKVHKLECIWTHMYKKKASQSLKKINERNF